MRHKQLSSSGKSTQKKKKFVVILKSGSLLLGLAKSILFNIINYHLLQYTVLQLFTDTAAYYLRLSLIIV